MAAWTTLCFCFVITLSGYAQTDLPYEDFRVQCLNLSALPGELTISSQSEYDRLLLNPSHHPDCKNYQLPRIDFEKKSLLGFRVSTGGCEEPMLTRRVFITDGEIVFSVSVADSGMCKSLYEKILWILIDRPHDKKIRFELKRV